MIYRRRIKTLTDDQIDQVIQFMREHTTKSHERTHKIYIPALNVLKKDKFFVGRLSELEVREICWYLDRIGILKEAQ